MQIYCFFFLGHESIAAIMTSRLRNLSVVARYWGDGDIKVSKIDNMPCEYIYRVRTVLKSP